ncbi:MAG: pyridoxamine 5'-phosphate oxidase family protein [Euryarchaeota archaeon]|nr:pyridoxamine 5'-phosphate oxidase family protein [Euryarchaeota archaeon]
MTEARVLASLRRVLHDTSLCSLATVADDGGPHICHVYFAFDQELRVHFLSHPDSAHCRHIRRSGRASISVYDSHQSWGGQDAGIAMDGVAKECRGTDETAAESTYARRFKGYRTWTRSSEFSRFGRRYRFYTFTPTSLKVFDERRLGPGLFLTARVR